MSEVLQGLPAAHAEALRRELDENERLLWAAVPVVWRAALPQLIPLVLFALVMGFMAVGCSVATAQIVREFQVLKESAGVATPRSSVWGLLGAAAMALGLYGVVFWSAKEAFSQIGRARRTVFAVTHTRILSLSFDLDGRVRCTSLEPRHPLALRRSENRDGSGTVQVHPSPSGESRYAGIALVGVPGPREVDRLIRKTFDPEG